MKSSVQAGKTRCFLCRGYRRGKRGLLASSVRSEKARGLFKAARFFVILCDTCHQPGECQQRNQVRNYHQPVEQIGKVPHQINFQSGTHHDEADHNDAVDADGLAKQSFYVDLAVKKYQPMMVEKAKNSMQIAMKILPKEPKV